MLYKQVLAVMILSFGLLSSGLALGAEDAGEAPPPPEDLIIATCAREVSLRWSVGGTEDHGVYQFRIYRGTSSGNESFYTSVDGTTRVYKDPHGDRNQTFYYYITAVNDFGESEPSQEVKATPSCGPIRPTQPRNLTYSIDEGKIELRWDRPLSHGGFEIYRYRIYRNKTGEGFELYDSVDGGDRKYIDRSVDTEDSYRYYVTALNRIGPSEESDIIEVDLNTYETYNMNLVLIFSLALLIVFLMMIGKS